MDTIRSFIENASGRWASYIVGHPWKTIVVALLVNTMFGLCFLSLKPNNDIRDLYVAKGTHAEELRDKLLSYFPDHSDSAFNPQTSVLPPLYADVIVSGVHAEDVLSRNVTDEIDSLVKEISEIEVTTFYGDTVDYLSLCAKYNDSCVIGGRSDADSDNIEDTLKSLPYPRYRKIRFFLRQDSAGRRQDSVKWLNKFIETMKNFKSDDLRIVYSHSLSFYEFLNSDTFPDITYFGLSFTIFIAYCGFFVSGGDCVSKRVNIGRMGIIVNPLSVMGAWGFLSGSNMSFTNACGVMPFVAMFLQANNMMLLLNRLSVNVDEKCYKTRVVKSVKESTLPLVTLTITVTVPFAFGILTKYTAMRIMSVYTVTTMIFMFVNRMTFFVACVTLHEKRINAGRHCCTCNTITTPDDPEVEGRSGCFRCCCTGRKPTTMEQTESRWERIPRLILSRIMLTTPMKFISVIFLLGFLGCSFWKVMSVKIDVYQEDCIMAETHFHDFSEINQRYFPNRPYISFSPDYRTDDDESSFEPKSILEKYNKLINVLGDRVSNSSTFWLESYSRSPLYSDVTPQAFLSGLKDFILVNKEFKDDIAFTENETSIRTFRFHLQASDMESSKQLIRLKGFLQSDDSVEDLDFDAYSPEFLLIDSYKTSLWELLRFMGIQFVVLVLVTLFVGNYGWFLVVHSAFIYIISCLGLITFASCLGVYITSLAMIVFVLGISYSTNVIMFTIHAYSTSEGPDAGARVHNVLVTTIPYLFSLSLASVLGLLILFLAKSYVFITVFKVLSVGSGVALLCSCFFFPTLLALTGSADPIYKPDDKSVISQMSMAATVAVKTNVESTCQYNGHAVYGIGNTNGYACQEHPQINEGFVDDCGQVESFKF